MDEGRKDSDSPNDTAVVKSEAEEDETSGHVCGVCGRRFPLLSSLSQHMRRHTRDKPYKCPYCEHRTAQKGSLKAHIRSHKLGLLGHSLEGEETDGGARRCDDPEIAGGSPAEIVDSSSEKEHNVNGKVKKKGPKKKVKGKDVETAEEETSCCNSKTAEQAVETAEGGPFSCSLCSQVFPTAVLLKAHAKKHRGAQDHGCRICGRRFRQAWFLQSHMRIHRAKAQLRGVDGDEPPATINGVSQDPASLNNEECLYELCAGCGNFFVDRRTLHIHKELHKHNHSRVQNQQPDQPTDSELITSKEYFLETLNLRRVRSEEVTVEKRPGRRILELDPICSYQAWQLATKGRLVEATEKSLGWEERLADAEVAYNKEKGEYVPLKQEKKRKQGDTSSAPLKKKKAGAGQERTANTSTDTSSASNGSHRGQSDHALFNGLGHAFYVALQKKKLKEVCHSTGQTDSVRNQDKKPFFCEHCDFHTVDASSLRCHTAKQHQGLMGPTSKQSSVMDNLRQSGSKDSKYMDYLRNRSALLSQPYWSPFASLPGQERAESGVKKEKPEVSEVMAGQGGTAPAANSADLLNLSGLPVGEARGEGDREVHAGGPVRRRCPYCSHTTNYPEVLWIHQRVSHKVDGASSLAPKWAPGAGGYKGSKAGSGGQWRRTGPPPFLEGKDCPALPAPRAQRTHAPASTAHASSAGSTSSTSSTSTGRRSVAKAQQGNATVKSKSATHSKHSQAADGSPSGRKTAPPPHKKKSPAGEQSRPEERGGKATDAHVTSSSSSAAYGAHSGSSAFRSTSSPKHRGHRVSIEGKLLPQEGLGFMLARNHARSPSHHSGADRVHGQGQTREPSSGSKGRDLWSAMNLWGIHRGRAYVDPPLFAQGKSESTGETQMDIDVLSLLKNYSPHDLAALYQHWGFVDPRLDPQAMLQLNGNFVNEVHSGSDASKQVNSHSTSSSGSLQKGT